MNYRLKRRFSRLGMILLIAAIFVFAIFPFYWAFISSIKAPADLFKVEFVPNEIVIENYASIAENKTFLSSIVNSLIVSTATILISLLVANFAGFSLSRIQFRYRRFLLMSILAVSMFPQIAVLSGMFELIRLFGLYNSLAGLILSYLILIVPFTTWVMKSFIEGLPVELEEAAILDGCRPPKILFRVFLPLLKPALVTTGLLSFIIAWNEFLFALTFVLSPEKRTVPVAITLMSGSSQHELPWGMITAASITVTIPIIILVIGFQRQIVSGLTQGATKG